MRDCAGSRGKDAVFRNEPMSRHTTFRTGGPAQLLVTPDMETLPEVVAFCRQGAASVSGDWETAAICCAETAAWTEL